MKTRYVIMLKFWPKQLNAQKDFLIQGLGLVVDLLVLKYQIVKVMIIPDGPGHDLVCAVRKVDVFLEAEAEDLVRVAQW